VNLVHLSSLDRLKGIIEIAQSWSSIKERLAGVRLHVIGGRSLYGDSTRHPLIPADDEVAARILGSIPQSDIDEGVVRFYGTLGEERHEVIRSCDIALLNPTGRTEAFPASPLDMMAMGLPVVASDDYGMADSMRFFPELAVRSISEIPERVGWLADDADQYRRMQVRAFDVARRLADAQQSSLERWSQLISELIHGRSPRQEMRPSMPFHGSRMTLLYRRDIKPRLGEAYRRLRR
jgi:glycosyltransferase involved in cell wall biosynthesis